jgi:hypothetical protein
MGRSGRKTASAEGEKDDFGFISIRSSSELQLL